jgi:hypothetical protein
LAADVAAENLGIGIDVISGSSCIPLEGFNINKLPEYARKPCQDQINFVSYKLLEYDTVILAGMWSYQLQDDLTSRLLESFFENARLKNYRVIVLAQIPKLKRNPARLLRLKHWGLEIPTVLDSDWINGNNKLKLLIKNHPATKFYSPADLKLFDNPPYYNNKIIYHDDHHLNEIGAKIYGQFLVNLINDIYSSN